MKKKTAPIGFGDNPKYVTCVTRGEKDPYDRKAVWRDENGKPYCLNLCYIGNRHRSHGTYWAFLPYREDFKGVFE